MRRYGLSGESPCNECQKRSAECHSNCQEYRDWKETRDKRAKTYRENKDKNAGGFDTHVYAWGILNKRR